jgi:hypothetical protein
VITDDPNEIEAAARASADPTEIPPGARAAAERLLTRLVAAVQKDDGEYRFALVRPAQLRSREEQERVDLMAVCFLHAVTFGQFDG